MATGGKTVGRVSIRVIPDTSRFRADLKKSLDRIEKQARLLVSVDADTKPARQAVLRLTKDIAKTKTGVGVTADTAEASRKIDGLADDRDVTVNADADTGVAATALALLARRRVAEIVPQISRGAAARATTMLAALSGARVAGDAVRRLSTSLSNVDRAVPKLATTAVAIGSLGVVALQSVAGLGSLATSLAQIAPLALMLPAAFTAAAAGIAALIVAWKDAGKQLAPLKSSMQELGDVMSARYWDAARKPIIEMTRTLLPELRLGMIGVSNSLGGMTGDLARAMQSNLGGGVLQGILRNVRDSITEARAAVAPFVEAFTTLGYTGSQYLPAIGRWLGEIGTRFNEWVQTADSNGNLTAWIENAATQFGYLVDVVKNLGSIIGGVFRAIGSGGGGLQNFAATLGTIAGIVNGPVFQTALSTIFAGAAQGAQALAGALGPIGNMLAALAPTISTVLAGLAATLATALTGISAALSQPVVATGLEAALAGIQGLVTGLLPALQPLGFLLGQLGQIVGQLGPVIGTVLGGALRALAPTITQVLMGLQPLIPVLGSALVGAVQALAPLLIQIGQAFQTLLPALGPVIQAITPLIGIVGQLAGALEPVVAALGQTLTQALTVLAPVVHQIGTTLGTVLLGAVQALLPALLQLVQQAMPIFLAIAQALGPTLQLLAPVVLAIAQAVGTLLLTAIQAVLPLLLQVAQTALPAFLSVVQALAPVLLQLVQALLPVLVSMFQAMAPVIAAVAPIVAQLVAAIAPLVAMIGNLLIPIIEALLPVVQTVFNTVANVIASVMQIVQGVIQVVTSAIRGDWSGVWNGILQILSGVWNTIEAIVTGAINIVRSVITAGINVIRSVWSSVWNGIKAVFSTIWSGLRQAAVAGVNNVVDTVTGIRDRILGFFSGAGSWLAESGRKIISGLIDGIKGMVGKVKNAVGGVMQAARNLLPFSPAKEGPFSGKGWSLYSGRSIVDALAQGVLDESGRLVAATTTVMSAANAAITDGGLSSVGLEGTVSDADAVGSGPRVVQHITNNFPQAEPTSVTTNKALQYAAAIGV
ncbi:phage tail protein [Puerhibacterium puerhi]|uniref:phage tail protein n=1 Tax=Puerhibacterium puerhi TaxID=2692623 RepID=UPI001356D1A0|nr:hypothetical protein [Puerhibacterium puerhi]